MNTTLEYKGYLGSVDIDTDRDVLRGEVINIRDVITYEGADPADLRKAFQESVDDYLAFCQERGESPDKPFSGNFLVRITPALHREISTAALVTGKSLNSWVAESLENAVHVVTAKGMRPISTKSKSVQEKPKKKAVFQAGKRFK